MITLGIILLLLGIFLTFHPLAWIGLVVVLVGVGLALLGRSGRPVLGRAHWY
ncbi:hypothetical protein GCM10027047_02140 [Rhodococcus aerolatus]